MDFTQSNYTLQAETSALQNVSSGLRKIFTRDPGISLQFLMTIPVIAAGIVFHVSALQWFAIIFVTLLYLLAGIFKTAALLQISKSDSYTLFAASRIRYMGTAGVVLTTGISLITYALVFIPKILLLL